MVQASRLHISLGHRQCAAETAAPQTLSSDKRDSGRRGARRCFWLLEFSVLPWIEGKFMSMSFRVPTMSVCALDMVAKTVDPVPKAEDLIQVFEKAAQDQRYKVIDNNYEGLTSMDFVASEHSAVVDHRWTMVLKESYCKLVVWYDNEWAYGMRVANLIAYLA